MLAVTTWILAAGAALMVIYMIDNNQLTSVLTSIASAARAAIDPALHYLNRRRIAPTPPSP